MGQAGGQQALTGFVPVQRDQLAKTLCLSRVVEESLLVQLYLPGLAVQQRDATKGKLFSAEIQVSEANVAVDDPG